MECIDEYDPEVQVFIDKYISMINDMQKSIAEQCMRYNYDEKKTYHLVMNDPGVLTAKSKLIEIMGIFRKTRIIFSEEDLASSQYHLPSDCNT